MRFSLSPNWKWRSKREADRIRVLGISRLCLHLCADCVWLSEREMSHRIRIKWWSLSTWEMRICADFPRIVMKLMIFAHANTEHNVVTEAEARVNPRRMTQRKSKNGTTQFKSQVIYLFPNCIWFLIHKSIAKNFLISILVFIYLVNWLLTYFILCSLD